MSSVDALGYLASASYSYSQDRQDGGSRALARYNSGGETAYNEFTGDNSDAIYFEQYSHLIHSYWHTHR